MTLSDVDIAQAHTPQPIEEIAAKAHIPSDVLIPYGRFKAKVNYRDLPPSQPGKVILVTGMSPTPAGEGKSTVLIGLVDALNSRGFNTSAALREPSQGPVMGVKGGAAGGGYSQVVPMEDINLHFTGDFHAIAAANNTLSALLDNHIQQGNELRIDPRRILWQRCMDVNDRSLRSIITGLGGKANGVPTQTGFTITAASEIMAIHGLSHSLADMKQRLARITVAFTEDGDAVTAGDLHAEGCMAALLKDAINPNLVQTLGGSPAFVHGGPFANIAHGCNSLIATQVASQVSDYVVTEAGFGSDLGAEKFFDIAMPAGNIPVAGTVIVCTIRSLKFNGGVDRNRLNEENTDALLAGVVNLERHVRNIRKFGVEPVVAVNLFTSDTSEERKVLREWATRSGVALEEVTVWADGGSGALGLADAVIASLHQSSQGEAPHPIYDPAEGIEASISTVGSEIYGASTVEYSPEAISDLRLIKDQGWDRLPVCISKTQYSFSDDPAKLGAPEGHTLHIRRLLPKTGAGFIVVLTGSVLTMPGLPKRPAADNIDITDDGVISGLF